MASVNYFLRSDAHDNQEVSVWACIFASKSEKGNRILFQICTDVKVPASVWSEKERRIFAPNATPTEAERYKEINEDLDNIRVLLLSEISTYEIYSPDMARSAVREYLNRKLMKINRAPIEIVPFIRWIIQRMLDGTETNKGVPFENSTIKQYSNLLSVIDTFSKYYKRTTGKSLCWSSFDDNGDTASMFMTYLDRTGYMVSTRNKYVSQFKTVLHLAKRERLHSHDGANYLYQVQEHSDEMAAKIYLTADEIESLYSMPLEKGSYRDKVRDVFLVGCYTGQRVSDYSRLSKENFKVTDNGIPVIKLTQVKTGNRICIPIVNDHLYEIVDKYDGEMPYIVSQDLNRDIKLILKDLSKTVPSLMEYRPTVLTMKEIRSEESGQKEYERDEYGNVIKHRYDLVSSHTARRSCITNLYKLHKFSDRQLMSISGHKDVDVFYAYVLLSGEEVAEEISRKLDDLKKQKSGGGKSNEDLF